MRQKMQHKPQSSTKRKKYQLTQYESGTTKSHAYTSIWNEKAFAEDNPRPPKRSRLEPQATQQTRPLSRESAPRTNIQRPPKHLPQLPKAPRQMSQVPQQVFFQGPVHITNVTIPQAIRASNIEDRAHLIQALYPAAVHDVDNYTNATAPMDAIENNYIKPTINLIKDGISTNVKDGSKLRLAAYKGQLEVVRALVNAGVNINEPDTNKFNALMYAAMEDRFEVVTFLVAQGAKLDAKNVVGETVFNLMERLQKPAMLLFLKAQKAWVCNGIAEVMLEQTISPQSWNEFCQGIAVSGIPVSVYDPYEVTNPEQREQLQQINEYLKNTSESLYDDSWFKRYLLQGPLIKPM